MIILDDPGRPVDPAMRARCASLIRELLADHSKCDRSKSWMWAGELIPWRSESLLAAMRERTTSSEADGSTHTPPDHQSADTPTPPPTT